MSFFMPAREWSVEAAMDLEVAVGVELARSGSAVGWGWRGGVAPSG